MKEEQMLILWLMIAAFIGFVVWKLMQEKDVTLTLAFTNKNDPPTEAPAISAPGRKHHGFLPV